MFRVVFCIKFLYISFSGLITSSVSLQLCGFCSDEFPLPLGAWVRLRYFIVVVLGLPYDFILC